MSYRSVVRRLAILFSLCATLACATGRQPPDFAYDHAASFAGLTTYSWFNDPKWAMPAGNSVVDGQFIDRRIREAVDESLSRKGFARVETDATFYVAYHEGSAGVLSQEKWDLHSEYVVDEPGLRLGTVTQPEQNPAFVPDSGTKYRKQTTLVLDIRDGQKKLIWRGGRTGKTGSNPDELGRSIDHAVERLLAEFPPKAGTPTAR